MSRNTPGHEEGKGSLKAPSTQDALLTQLLEGVYPQRGVQVIDPETERLGFPQSQIASVQAHIHGRAIREGGIRVYNTREVLAAADASQLLQTFQEGFPDNEASTVDSATTRLRRTLQADGIVEGAREPKIYHVSNGLSYAFARTFGWIDPVGLSWLCADHLAISEYEERDTFGIFHALNPLALAGYESFDGSFYGHGQRILGGLGIDVKDPDVMRLLGMSVLLEIDPSVFTRQLGVSGLKANSLILRAHGDGRVADVEVISPVLASDTLLGPQGNYYCKVKALLRPLPT